MILDNILVLAKNVSLASVTTSNAFPSGFNVYQMDAVYRMLINNASANYDFTRRSAAAANDLGRAGDAMLNVMVGSTALLAGSGVGQLTFKLGEKSAAASFASATAVWEVGQTANIATSAASNANYAAGKPLIRTAIPSDIWGDSTNKFIGLLVAMSGNKIASGTITAWISPNSEAINRGL